MKLLGNRILVEIVPPPTEPSAIVLPQTIEPKPHFGRIRMLGTPRRGHPGVTHAGHLLSELAVGNLVRLNTNQGAVQITHDGRPMQIMSTLDILAVIE